MLFAIHAYESTHCGLHGIEDFLITECKNEREAQEIAYAMSRDVLPWLGSNDALPLATRMETRLPWRPTRASVSLGVFSESH